jgi:hypothetical protein
MICLSLCASVHLLSIFLINKYDGDKKGKVDETCISSNNTSIPGTEDNKAKDEKFCLSELAWFGMLA